MAEFSEKYDLTEQAFRHKQEELERQTRSGMQARRMEMLQNIGGGFLVAAVVITIAVLIYLYNTGPEPAPDNSKQEFQIACLDRGGIVLDPQGSSGPVCVKTLEEVSNG